MNRTETRTIIDRVSDYGPKPKTAFQVLRQAHDLLAEEGKWVAGTYFRDGDAQEAYEASSCGSWQACAMGAIGLVNGDMTISVTRDWTEYDRSFLHADWKQEVSHDYTVLGFEDWVSNGGYVPTEDENIFDGESSYFWNEADAENWSEFTYDAAVALAVAMGKDERDYRNHPDAAISEVIDFNDQGTGRTAVLALFQKGMKVAQNQARRTRKNKEK